MYSPSVSQQIALRVTCVVLLVHKLVQQRVAVKRSMGLLSLLFAVRGENRKGVQRH